MPAYKGKYLLRSKLPKYAEARRAEAERRLRLVRNHFGLIPLQLWASLAKPGGQGHLGFCGSVLNVKLPEAVDAWAFWADLIRFTKAWRPERIRSQAAAAAVREAWAIWESAGER